MDTMRITKSAVVAIVFSLAIMITPYSAKAQTQNAEAAQETYTCEFANDVSALKALKLQIEKEGDAEALEALMLLETELRARIFENAVLCAEKNAKELRDSVKELQILDRDGKALQSGFVEEIGAAIEYYAKMRVAVTSTDGKTIKSSATELLTWRERVYAPLSERVRYFILWTQNQDLIEKARVRLSQARQTILALKLAQNEGVQMEFERVRTFLLRSEETHIRAQQSFTRREAPTATLGHIKASLSELYRVYETFFTLSSEVQRARAK